jgi:hypothetical protein
VNRRWRWTLALAVIASVAGNVFEALLTTGPGYAVAAGLVAAVPPAFLFLVTHNLAAESAVASRLWRDRAAVAGAWLITLMSFAGSYIELHHLVLLLGRSTPAAVLTPLIVDATIAVSSVMVLDRPAVVRASARAPKPAPRGTVVTTPVAPKPVAAKRSPAPAPPAASTAPGLRLVPGTADRHAAAAAAIVDARAVKADVESVATVLAMLEQGTSVRGIGLATGLTRGTVERIRNARLELDREAVGV